TKKEIPMIKIQSFAGKAVATLVTRVGLCMTATVHADSVSTYPSRAITVTTPTAAGGGTDIVARVVSERLASVLGQSIVVANKPGAGGVIGNQAMLREKNDGYSLFITANSNQLIVPWVFKDANFDPINDFEPIAGLGIVPYVLAV